MRTHFHAHTYVKGILAAALVLTPVKGFSFAEIDDLDFHIEQLGVKQDLDKLLKSVLSLTLKSGKRAMIQTAARFKRDLDQYKSTGITLQTAVQMVNTKLVENGIRLHKKHIDQLTRLLALESNALGKVIVAEREYEVLDIPDGVAFGFVFVFCGVLLSVLPIPYAQSLGAGMITGGIGYICQSYSDNKRK